MIIAARYNGPPGSGNGGYTCGLVAGHFADPGAVEVTLRRPPPLDTELSVTLVGAGDETAVRVHLGAQLIAEGAPAVLGDDDVVAPVGFDEAVEASRSYLGFAHHPFPTCFVCGPRRPDGLRLFPGRLADGRTAAPFVAPADVSEVLMWAALDCPGGWAVPLETREYLLGRLTARIDAVPAPGEPCVVVGRLVGEQGRKAYALTTVYSPAGEVLATARATWVAIAG